MGRPVTGKKVKNWTKQFLDVKKIADEPPMNRQGFWKKPDYPHVTDKKTSVK